MSTPVECRNGYRPETVATRLPEAVASPPAPPEQPVTLIRPPRNWQLINVRELWQFHELLFFLVWRDVKVRYKQAVLGAAWAVLQPALMMAVFTIFFSRVARMSSGALPYELFVYAGLLPWLFFSTAITTAGNSAVNSERLITKIYFPRLVIPFASCGAAFLDMLIGFGLLIGLMIWHGIMPGWGLFLIPVFLLFIVLTAVGVGTFLAALNVAYRDVRHILPFLAQFWMFATPVIYMQPAAVAASPYRLLLHANPLNALIAGFRSATLGQPIGWADVALSGAVSVLLFVGGCLYFRKIEDSFADIL